MHELGGVFAGGLALGVLCSWLGWEVRCRVRWNAIEKQGFARGFTQGFETATRQLLAARAKRQAQAMGELGITERRP